MKHTRQDYLQNRCTHREYYAQFVTPEIIEYVVKMIGEDVIRKSTDPNFNDIPLSKWDSIAYRPEHHEQFKACGDYLSQAGAVCIAKEAAKQFKEKAA